MSQFIQALAKQIANRLIVPKLAKSKAFQNFAQKTVRGQEGVSNLGKGAADKVAETAKLAKNETNTAFRNIQNEIKKDLGLSGASKSASGKQKSFFEQLKEEVKKDLAK